MLYVYDEAAADGWVEAFSHALPGLPVAAFPKAVDEHQVRFVAVWAPPPDFFRRFANLEAVFSLGAGVDKLVGRADLPEGVPLIRITDAGMAQQMLEYALFGVLRFQRSMDVYARQQATATWRQWPPRLASATSVGVLGLGAIGSVVASGIAALGYQVTGWSRSPKTLAGVTCRAGTDALDAVLAASDILVSVLPSTPETRGLLDHRRLSLLPKGAAVINGGRGEQIDLEALIALIDSGHLRGAQLDVFTQEPLPSSNPAWTHPGILVTPHVAAVTLYAPSARQVAERIADLAAGRQPSGIVDRARSY